MLSSAERDALIRRIAELPERVERAVRDLSDAELDTPYREHGWTVRQVVHHLPDSHMNGYVRMKLTLTEERPRLKPYDQDAWSNLPDARLPIAPSLLVLKGLHERWVALMRAIPEKAWERRAFHLADGDLGMEDLLISYATHGEKHLAQIEGVRAKAR